MVEMKFVEWTPAMSVNSDSLDGHHQMIIDCLNQLHPLLETTGRQTEIKTVIEQLEDFVLIHFSEEEQAIRRAGFPDWKAHKALHDQMYDVVYSLKSDIEHDRAVDAKRLFDMLYEWLMKHILGEDKKYVPFLANPTPEAGAVWHRSNGRDD